MNHRMLFLVVSMSALPLALWQCSSGDDNPTDGGGDSSTNDSSTKDSGGGDSSANDSGNPDSGNTDSGGDAASGTQLTVKNVDVWCNISVNGGAASSAASQVVNVQPGTIPLTAEPLNGFILGDWHHTTGDTDAGDPGLVDGGVSSTTVTVGTSAACVWICCPHTNGTGCPTTDQCP